MLGASATAVGIVAGFGELLGYGLRLASGYLSDRTGRYWANTIIGYFISLLAVPTLALAGHWGVAAALMITERVGKAVRTPARVMWNSWKKDAAARLGLIDKMPFDGSYCL